MRFVVSHFYHKFSCNGNKFYYHIITRKFVRKKKKNYKKFIYEIFLSELKIKFSKSELKIKFRKFLGSTQKRNRRKKRKLTKNKM